MNIFEAVKSGKLKNVKKALNDFPESVNAIDRYGCTALHIAVGKNDTLENDALEIIKELLANGASVRAVEQFERTVLHIAASKNNDPEVIQILVDAGADIHAVDNYNITALHEAAEKNINPKVIQKLLDLKANLSAEDNEQRTPLDVANKDVAIVLQKALYIKDRATSEQDDVILRNMEIVFKPYFENASPELVDIPDQNQNIAKPPIQNSDTISEKNGEEKQKEEKQQQLREMVTPLNGNIPHINQLMNGDMAKKNIPRQNQHPRKANNRWQRIFKKRDYKPKLSV